MINLLQRVQDISKISNVLFSIIIIAVVTYLHVMTTPSIEIDIFLSIDKVVHMIIFYFVGLWFFLITKQDHSFILMILLFIYALTMELLQMTLHTEVLIGLIGLQMYLDFVKFFSSF